MPEVRESPDGTGVRDFPRGAERSKGNRMDAVFLPTDREKQPCG